MEGNADEAAMNTLAYRYKTWTGTTNLSKTTFTANYTTMDDMYGDGSYHRACTVCGFCIDCGDCECERRRSSEDFMRGMAFGL